MPVTEGAETATDPEPAPTGAIPILVGMGRVYAILGSLLLVVVHEALHGLAMVLCGVPAGEVDHPSLPGCYVLPA